MRLGIDLGGTKIEGIVLDAGRQVARRRVPTPRDDYDATITAIASLVTQLEADAGAPGTIGIGIPGTISPATGLVKNANSIWLIGRPLHDDLRRVLGREVKIANDANCFAVSEATDGAGAGADVVFGVIVGTGTGAGVVVRGQVLTGPHAIAGEWGHNPLPWPGAGEWPGPSCYCGKNGCIETFLSGPGLAADFARSAGLLREAAARAEDVVALAAAGDAAATAAIERYEQRMARALASIINVLDPDVIVLGGGMSNISRLYDNVPRYWTEFVFARGPREEVRARLVPARHGDSSGVRGAAWLWNDA
jgi:fructokinase